MARGVALLWEGNGVKFFLTEGAGTGACTVWNRLVFNIDLKGWYCRVKIRGGGLCIQSIPSCLASSYQPLLASLSIEQVCVLQKPSLCHHPTARAPGMLNNRTQLP